MKAARSGLSARALSALLVAFTAVAGAGCPGDTEPKAPEEEVVGRIRADVVEGGVVLVVDGLARPIRSLQVDVKLDGANGLLARALNGNDVLEAGLEAPRDDFTVVVSDTRRVPLVPGAVVQVDTDRGPTGVTLSRALAVDTEGARVALTVGAP